MTPLSTESPQYTSALCVFSGTSRSNFRSNFNLRRAESIIIRPAALCAHAPQCQKDLLHIFKSAWLALQIKKLSYMKRADGATGAAAVASKKPRNDDDEPDFDFDDFDEAEVDMYLAGSVDAAVSGFTVPEHSKQRWLRPAPPPIDSAVHDISMQQIEIDYYIGEGRQDLPGAQEGAAAILRIYGVTQDGNSCMVHVHQYEPYFFIQAPQGFTEADAPAFAEQLNQITEGQDKSKSKPARYIRRVELCHLCSYCGAAMFPRARGF
jgi:hypothetical protein